MAIFRKKDVTLCPQTYTCFIDMIDTSAFQGKTAAFYTLGCKLNFSETSTFGKMLQELGVRTAHKGEQADTILLSSFCLSISLWILMRSAIVMVLAPFKMF